MRLRDLKSRLEILLSLCSPVIGIILTARLMVAMILLLLKILMSVSWDKMIVITFVKTIQWVVTDAGVTKVTSYLVTIEHAKVKKKKQSREKMVHTSNRSQDTPIPTGPISRWLTSKSTEVANEPLGQCVTDVLTTF